MRKLLGNTTEEGPLHSAQRRNLVVQEKIVQKLKPRFKMKHKHGKTSRTKQLQQLAATPVESANPTFWSHNPQARLGPPHQSVRRFVRKFGNSKNRHTTVVRTCPVSKHMSVCFKTGKILDLSEGGGPDVLVPIFMQHKHFWFEALVDVTCLLIDMSNVNSHGNRK